MSINRPPLLRQVVPLILACLLASAPFAHAGVGFWFSLTDTLTSNPLIKQPVQGISAFQDRAVLDYRSAEVAKDITIDSSFTIVIFTTKMRDTHLLQPTILSYTAYRDLRLRRDVADLTRSEFKKNFKQTALGGGGEGIAIDVPFRIKSKTFRRLFGGDNIGLRVSGNITINGNLRRQKFDELQTANQQNSNTSFRIDMVQRFSITGKIGQKVEVKVDQDSERLFDFENSIKLTYTGTEDEIVQKVEAGNVALNLGTKLATFSGRNTGLFGLKTQMKMGPLSLTGIASLERGEKNKQSPNLRSQRASFTEKDFLRNTYFWLTNTEVFGGTPPGMIAPDFRENYRKYDGRQHIAIYQDYEIQDIKVYVSTTNTNTESFPFGRAAAVQYLDYLDLDEDAFTDSVSVINDLETWNWRLLNTSEYYLEPQLGYIRLRQAVQDGQALACAFVTAHGDTFGTLDANLDSIALVLLKPATPQVNDVTWDLMFRHVYSLQATNLDPEDFKLTITREASDQLDETGPEGTGITYLQYFRFDETAQSGTGADGLVDNIPSLIDHSRGELHFLDLTPFNPSGYWDPPGTPEPNILWNLAALDSVDSAGFLAPYLYNALQSQVNQQGNNWRFSTEYKGSTASFDLGPLVLEGSEEVKLNGQPLQRGSDYTIDYMSGQLKILNEAAKAPGADLQITYESGSVFQLDKKTLLGARAEYELWQDSYIGGMWLYLNEKSLDERVRIGNEPIRNTLYDLNTSLNFKPKFLTPLVNKLPLVESDVQSEIRIDGEVARVFPNPNSLENADTKDFNGLAYLDDFEGSRRAAPLGLMRRTWTISSIPDDPDIDMRRGRFRWWNPTVRDQVLVKDVFPEREVNSQVANTLQSMILEFVPDENDGQPEKSWGGIMRFLGEGYADQSRAQFLEFWIQLPRGAPNNGKLIVDLGEISEDALPNRKMDSEDRPVPGQNTSSDLQEYGNGVLEPEEDTGIDGINANDPADSAYWNGTDQPPIPSLDDWQYSSGSNDFQHINGTENNRNDESGGFPDTEDLNNNDRLDLSNSYFSYTIELNDNSPYIAGGQDNDKRWRMFRIPLDVEDPSVVQRVNDPSLTNIMWARLYMTGFEDSTRIEIVQMDIVSNEWLAETTTNDSTEYITPAVINTHENPGYDSPPGVRGELDPITRLRQREQSLVLQINELSNVSDVVPNEFFISKNLYQQINMLEYKKLKMFIHGGGIDENAFPEETYELILRLGRNYNNISTNYYEIIKPVKRGWHPNNEIDLTLNEISFLHSLRDQAILATTEIVGYDTTGGDSIPIYESPIGATDRFAVAVDTLLHPGDSLVINGTPTFQSIGFLALGVRMTPKYMDRMNDEIWVDELRVSDIYKESGTAGEITTSIKLSDLATMNASYTTRDADFHNVNTRIGSNTSTETWRGTLNLDMHRFHLHRWGFALPVTVNYTETNGTPKYIPNTDTRVVKDLAPDSIKSHEQTVTYTARYSKSGGSPNPLVRWTMEKLSGSWSLTHSTARNDRIRESESKQTDASASYSFPTSRGRGIAPLWWLQRVPLFRMLGSPKFFYKPTRLSGSVSASKRRSFNETRQNILTTSRAFNTNRSATIGYQPFTTVNMDYTRSWKGVMDSTQTWGDLLNGEFGRLQDLQQNASTTYSPTLASWFKPNLHYNSSYSWRYADFTRTNSQQVTNSRAIGGDVQLDLRSILGGSGASRERPSEPSGPKEGDETDSTVTEPVKQPGPSLGQRLRTVFSPVRKALLILDPVTLRYDKTNGHSASGVDGQAAMDYQFGFTQNPGNYSDDTTYVSRPTSRSSDDYSARSGIKLTKNIRTSFNYNLKLSENVSTQSTGSREETQLWLGNSGDIVSYPFADVSLDWSGLERLAFLSNVTSSVSVNSSVSGRLRETWTGSSDNIQNKEYTRQWNPLLGLNISWRGNIESQIRFNTGRTFTNDVIMVKKTRTSDSQISTTLSYTIHTGFRIPLLWLRRMRLENQTTLSMNFDYRSTKKETTESTEEIYVLKEKTSSWSLSPRMTYSFSNTVQGQGYVQLQQNKNEVNGSKSRVFEFGIQVNIAIRG